MRLIVHSDRLFVAAINGPAAGVGLAFAMACDLVIASDRARLLMAFGRIELVSEVGLGWLLTRRLGYHKAMTLFVSATMLSAEQALGLGWSTRWSGTRSSRRGPNPGAGARWLCLRTRST